MVQHPVAPSLTYPVRPHPPYDLTNIEIAIKENEIDCLSPERFDFVSCDLFYGIELSATTQQENEGMEVSTMPLSRCVAKSSENPHWRSTPEKPKFLPQNFQQNLVRRPSGNPSVFGFASSDVIHLVALTCGHL